MPSAESPESGAPRIAPGATPLLLDVMLGKLAVYLRLCGYDAAYAGDRGVEADERLLAVAADEGRVLVSRDRSLVERADAGLLLAARDVEAQLEELRAAGAELTPADRPTRCGRCNGVLEGVPADAERPDYAPPPGEHDCWRCVECGQFFWRGSHWDRMRDALGSRGP